MAVIQNCEGCRYDGKRLCKVKNALNRGEIPTVLSENYTFKNIATESQEVVYYCSRWGEVPERPRKLPSPPAPLPGQMELFG